MGCVPSLHGGEGLAHLLSLLYKGECATQKSNFTDHPAGNWQDHDFRGHSFINIWLQRHKQQKNDPPGEGSKDGQTPEVPPCHGTYYLDPNMSSLLWGTFYCQKKKIQLLTLRELVGLKAAVSAPDIFLHSNYIWIQRALSQQLRGPTWEASLKSLLSVVPKWIRVSVPFSGKRGREGERGRDEGRRQREWGIKTYKRVKNNEWILK